MALSDDILDRTVLHATRLERYKNRLTRDILRLIRETEGRVAAEVARRDIADLSRRDLNRLLTRLKKIINDGYEPVTEALDREIQALGSAEADWQVKVLDDLLPIEFNVDAPSPGQIYAAAHARPFNGGLLRDWYKGLPDGQFRRVREVIRQGYADGRTTAQIVGDVRGTRNRQGVIQQGRRAAETTVRTAVQHTANVAREGVFRRNSRVIAKVEWVSTLDTRTTMICISRDGKTWPVGKGPRPPAHPNCRSTVIPITKRADRLNFKEKPGRTRASMNGQVPADLTYGEWLRKQPAAIQDEVLGKTRGALFRRGELSVDAFVNRKGAMYTLDELREREAEAFEKAKVA